MSPGGLGFRQGTTDQRFLHHGVLIVGVAVTNPNHRLNHQKGTLFPRMLKFVCRQPAFILGENAKNNFIQKYQPNIKGTLCEYE